MEHNLVHRYYPDEDVEEIRIKIYVGVEESFSNGGLSKKNCLNQSIAMEATKLYKILTKNVLYV